MKRMLLLIVLFFGVAGSFAQQAPKSVTESEPTVADVLHFLNGRGSFMKTYDLSGLGNPNHSIELILDEYHGRDSVRTLLEGLGIGPIGVMKEGETEVSMKTLLLGVDRLSDTLSILTAKVGREGLNGFSLELKPVVPSKKPLYSYRPFKLGPIEPGVKIPVFLYGSGWIDEEVSKQIGEPYVRMCGSSEVDREMTDPMFDDSPHYYIFSIRLWE